jgi:hypothetical protein
MTSPPGGATASVPSLTKATLSDGINIVTFNFNPKTITVSHSAQLREIGVQKSDQQVAKLPTSAPSGSAGSDNSALTNQQVVEKQGGTTLKLSDLVFDGAEVLKNCGQMLAWTYAAQDPTAQDSDVKLPVLTFNWGGFQLGENTSTAIAVQLTRAEVKYERFDSDGTPVRATVGLDMQPTASNPLAQNPTSGGPSGRRGHVMIAGETLPSLALTAYGRPGNWRTLAEANDLDDPLRVRPGDVLYVPNRAELNGQGSA